MTTPAKPRVMLANAFLAVACAVTDPRRVWILLLAAALAAVAVLTGCATTAEDQWYQARSTLNVAEKVFIAQTPRLTDEEIVARGRLLMQAAVTLNQAKTHLPAGGPAFDALLVAFEAYLESIAPSPPTGDSHGGPGDSRSDP